MQPLSINPTNNNLVMGPSSLGANGGSMGPTGSGLGSGSQPPDPTMPTLSPHPPQLKKEGELTVVSSASTVPVTSSVVTVSPRTVYVGPLGKGSAKLGTFCKDVSEHASVLVKALKKRPHLLPSIQEEDISREFKSFYEESSDPHRFNTNKKIKVEVEPVIKEEPYWTAGTSSSTVMLGDNLSVPRSRSRDPSNRPSPDPYEFGSGIRNCRPA
jgi:hypothetical protein